MSDLTEQEIISKHIQSLKESKEMCLLLARNADPEKWAPRGWQYTKLKAALKALEGTCRQMAHYREDTRWIKLGIVYTKASLTVQVLMDKRLWGKFQQLTALFDKGMASMDDLANRRTGRSGMILPSTRTDWLVMPSPDQLRKTIH